MSEKHAYSLETMCKMLLELDKRMERIERILLPENAPLDMDDESSDAFWQEVAVTSGNLSDTVQWEYDAEMQTVTIRGSGGFCDYYRPEPETPWKPFRNRIRRVVFEDGITTIGMQCFYEYPNIEEVVIPDSVTDIRPAAFEGCRKLYTVIMRDKIYPIRTFFERDSMPEGSVCLWLNAFFLTPWAKEHEVEW